MSDTDSENDYESADEDTEESVSKSEESVSKLEKSVLKLEENFSKIEQEISVELQKDISKLKIISENKDVANMKTNFVEVPPDIKDPVQKINDNENECVIHDIIESKKFNDLSDDEKELIDYSKDSLKDSTNLFNCEKDDLTNINSQTAEKKSSVTITAPSKRVTLRLERKLQERTQSLPSNESIKETKKGEKSASSWGFSSWGTTLLSTAASSVSTFTNQVSQGIGTVFETVESTLGAPPPEDLAAILKEKREKEVLTELNSEPNKEESNQLERETNLEDDNKAEELKNPTSMLFTGVTSITKVVGDTSSKVFMGGLDTLEMIGKKTMDILTEGDPGLRHKRSAFSSGITLSQMLREAKEKAEDDTKASLQEQEDAIHYSRFFDDFQGLVHLEALEMLSNQCQSKVQRALLMLSNDSDDKYIIEQINKVCEDLPSADETPDTEIEQDFNTAVSEHLKVLQLNINLGKIENTRNTINEWLDKCLEEQEKGTRKDAKEIYRHAISSLAEFTARCVEQFHKFGELIMVQNSGEFDALMTATHLTGLTSVLCLEISILATKYCQCLNIAADDSEDPDSVTPLITSVYLEASNSATYVQDAFQLLVPVLQTILVE